ncbi:MAG: transposase, partial [Deltaproteobacteria bacterium]|nr:transposase [Deltaproteobacteria bacterium]
ASRLLDLFTRTVFAWQRRQARRRGVADPRTGGVTNLNVHFHTLVPDGVFDEEGAGPPRFVPVPFSNQRHTASLGWTTTTGSGSSPTRACRAP